MAPPLSIHIFIKEENQYNELAAGKAIPFLRNFLEILLSLHFALIFRGYHAPL